MKRTYPSIFFSLDHVNEILERREELLLTGSDPNIVELFSNFLLNHPDASFLEIVERKECISDESNGQTDCTAMS